MTDQNKRNVELVSGADSDVYEFNGCITLDKVNRMFAEFLAMGTSEVRFRYVKNERGFDIAMTTDGAPTHKMRWPRTQTERDEMKQEDQEMLDKCVESAKESAKVLRESGAYELADNLLLRTGYVVGLVIRLEKLTQKGQV